MLFSQGGLKAHQSGPCGLQKQWDSRGSFDVYLRGQKSGPELAGGGMLRVEIVPSNF